MHFKGFIISLFSNIYLCLLYTDFFRLLPKYLIFMSFITCSWNVDMVNTTMNSNAYYKKTCNHKENVV